MTAQRGTTRLGRGQTIDGGGQDAQIAGHRMGRPRGEGRGDQVEDLRIGGGGIGAVEDLEPDLQVFARAALVDLLPPEDFARVTVPCNVRAVVHMRLHDRHREVRAQHRLARQRVVGGESAGADIFAIQIQQGARRLQDFGLDKGRARVEETLQKGRGPLAVGGADHSESF